MRRTSSRGAALAAAAALAAVLACAPAHEAGPLLADMRSPDSELRQDAAETLAGIVARGEFQVFVRGARAGEPIDRVQSMLYLAQMPQPGARAALVDLLRLDARAMVPFNPVRLKPSAELSDSRILVAGLIARNGGDPKAVPALLENVDARLPADVLAGTCFALGALRRAEGAPFLASMARHANLAVVRAAIQSIGQIGGEEALPVLRAAAAHPALEVRGDVLSALEIRDNPAARAVVRTMAASDPSFDLRVAALRRLARCTDDDCVSFLIGELERPSDPARPVVLEVLSRIAGRSLGPRTKAWTRWWADEQARRAAARPAS